MIALIFTLVLVLLCIICIYATKDNKDTRVTLWLFYVAFAVMIIGCVGYYPAEKYAAINRVENNQVEQSAKLNIEVERADKMIAILGSSQAYLNYLLANKAED